MQAVVPYNETVKNDIALESYLKKIVTTSIVNVLKDSGRVQRTRDGFVSSPETSLDEIISMPDNKYSNISVNYDLIDLKDGPEEVVIKKEILQALSDAIYISHCLNPTKQYMQLYELRYIKGLKQKQIAEELNLSQSEISKRLLNLMEEVKVAFTKI